MNPCKDCPDRTEDCHGYCEEWKEWKAQHEKDKERERLYKLKTEQYYPPKRRRGKWRA